MRTDTKTDLVESSGPDSSSGSLGVVVDGASPGEREKMRHCSEDSADRSLFSLEQAQQMTSVDNIAKS